LNGKEEREGKGKREGHVRFNWYLPIHLLLLGQGGLEGRRGWRGDIIHVSDLIRSIRKESELSRVRRARLRERLRTKRERKRDDERRQREREEKKYQCTNVWLGRCHP